MDIKWLIAFALCMVCSASWAQNEKLVQFSGIVSTTDSSVVIPYVTITNKSRHNTVHLANYQGYFSFVTHKADTLVFSAVGYKPITVVIPSSITDQRYTLMIRMQSAIINLPTVHIYPWANLEEFKHDLMTMQIADGDLEIAKKNLARQKLAASYVDLPRDGLEMRGFDFQYEHNYLLNKSMNQRYDTPLLNPFAWKNFLEQIFRKDKTDKNKSQ